MLRKFSLRLLMFFKNFISAIRNTKIVQAIDLLVLEHKSRKNDGSYAGEYEFLKNLTAQLKIIDGFLVDVAASDGFTQSCTLGFIREGWGGLMVEMDPIKFSKLAFIHSKFPKVKLARNRVTPFNICPLLDAFEVNKDIDILNIDIDSYDLYVIEEILKAGNRPKVISMEINEKIPPEIFFTVNYDDTHYWQGDHFYGCSIAAASDIIKKFGYLLYSLEYNNAFFIRSDLAATKNYTDLSPIEAYDKGYKQKSDRKTIFPWNHNVEHWINISPAQSIEFIKEFFNKYEGKYTLKLSSDEAA